MCAWVGDRIRQELVFHKALLCLAMLGFAAGSVRAEDHFWSSLGGGSFNYWLNWVPNWVPGEDDNAIFDLDMDPAYEVTFYEGVTNQRCVFRTDEVIFNLGGHTYTLIDPDFALIVGEDIGQVAEALLYNGTLNATHAHIGLWDDSAGRLDLESGATLNVSGALTIGNDGDGVMNAHSGASVATEYATVAGHSLGNTGVLSVDGSSAEFTVNQIFRVGDSGTGTFNLLNGASAYSQVGYVGDAPTGFGEVNISGGSEFIVGEWFVIGSSGTGAISVTEAGEFSIVDLYVGNAPGADGSVDLSDADSRLDADGYVAVGNSGHGVMNVSQRAAMTADTLAVGADETADGELNVSGSGTTVTVSHNIRSGSDGVGIINITCGADVRTTEDDGSIYIGQWETGNGYLLVDGGSTLTAEQAALVIGDHGQGAADILNGSEVHTGGELFMGWWDGSCGRLTISGAGSKYTIDTGYPAQVGDGGEGTLIVADGGQFEKPGGFRLGLQGTGVGRVTLSGGGSSFRCGEHLGIGEYGAGTFTVNDGRVAVGNVDIADVPSGEVRVGDWGKLTGTGTLTGNVTNFNGGSVRPGGDPASTQTGIFTIDGDYTQEDGQLAIRIRGNTAGGEYSSLSVTGSASIDGELQVMPVEGFEPQPGDEFVVLTAAAVNDTFSGQSGPVPFIVTYNPDSVVVTIPYPGDMNCDLSVDLLDVEAFVMAMLDPVAYQSAHPTCSVMLADMDGNGIVDGLDIQLFVDVLLAS